MGSDPFEIIIQPFHVEFIRHLSGRPFLRFGRQQDTPQMTGIRYMDLLPVFLPCLQQFFPVSIQMHHFIIRWERKWQFLPIITPV